MGKKLLVVVDMQNDFVDGALANPLAKQSIPYILGEIDSYDYIIYTQDTHDITYLNTQEGKNLPIPHCIHGTEGWKIVDVLKPSKFGNKVIHIVEKGTFGTNWQEGEISIPSDVTEVVFVGTCTDICVVSNVLNFKAAHPELPITVIAKCCSGTTVDRHLAALEVMRSCQVNVEFN